MEEDLKGKLTGLFMFWIMIGTVLVPLMGLVMIGSETARAEHSADGNTVALWHFNEGSGQNVTDSSGNGNNGTRGPTSGVEANDPTWVNGKFGKALDFDGSNDYVNVPDDNSLDITSAFTIEAWIQPFTLSNTMFIASKTYDDNNEGWEFAVQTKQMFFSISNTAADGNKDVIKSNQILAQNTWYYVAGVYDGSKLKLYINGTIDNETTVSYGLRANSEPVRIGTYKRFDGTIVNPFMWNGFIDDVRISNIERSSQEVIENYNKAFLKGYWKFDEGSGQYAGDSSGNANNLTLGPTSGSEAQDPVWVEGKFGNALKFDGTNDHLECNWDTSLSLPSVLTIEAWIKTDAINAPIVSARGGGNNNQYYLGLGGTGKLFFDRFDPGGGAVISTGTVNDGRWHHVAAVMIDSEDKVIFYIDGKGETVSYTESYTGGTPTKFAIGYDAADTPDHWFNGTIDEVRIWNIARTTQQISEYYNKSVMAGYWKFDEGSGQVASDSSGNGNHGQLGNTTGVDAMDPTWVNGISGKAMEFDGVDDRIFLNKKTISGRGARTVEAWFKTPQGNKYRIIYSENGIGSEARGMYLRINDDGKVMAAIGKTTFTIWLAYAISPLSYDDNKWHYAVYSWDGTTDPGASKLYVDGIEVNNQTATGTDQGGESTHDGAIGTHDRPGNISVFNGTIDEVRIWNYARSASEISDYYNSIQIFKPIISENFTGTNGALPDPDIWTVYEDDGTARIENNKLKLTPGPVWAGTGAFTTKTYPNTGIYTVESKVTFQKGTNIADNLFLWITDPYYDRDTDNYYHYMGTQIYLFQAYSYANAMKFQYTKQVNGNHSSEWGENVWWGVNKSYSFASTETFFTKAQYNADTGEVSSEVYASDHTLIVKRTGFVSPGVIGQLEDGLRFELHHGGYNANPVWWDYVYINWSGAELPDLKVTSNDISFSNPNPDNNEEIAITADIRNIGYSDIIFEDGFEDGMGKWTQKFGTTNTSSVKSHTGSKSAVIDEDLEVIKHKFTTNLTGMVEFWFFDLNTTSAQSIVGITELVPGNGSFSLGIITAKSQNYYILQTGGWSNTQITNIKRTEGWHKFSFFSDGTQSKAYIDDQLVKTTTKYKSFIQLEIGDWWGDTSYMTTYVDDVLVSASPVNASISFYDGNPGSGGSLIGSNQLSVWGNSPFQSSINWTATSGSHDIYVRIENVTPIDSDLSNNMAFKSITVGSETGLSIIDSDITFSNNNPQPSEEVTIYAKVKNDGNASSSATVKFWDRDPSDIVNATLIASKTVTNLGAGANTTVSTPWQVSSVPNNYTVFVTIEDVTPADADYTNNKAESANLTVSGSAPNAPELSISSSGIVFDNNQPNDGETVRIYAKIWNNGLQDATSANVTFWDGDPSNGGYFIGNVISQFASGYLTVRFVDWKVSSGTHTVYVWVKDVVPADANTANNKAFTTLVVNQKPLLVKPLPDIQFNEDTIHHSPFTLNDYFSDTSYVGLGVGKDHTQLTFNDSAQRYPFFSPDGNYIIYDSSEDGGSYRDIWRIDADGSNAVRLTNEAYHQDQPAYSPDGNYIIYSSVEDTGGFFDIWLMDADGTNHVQLTFNDYNQSAPKFSPDGTQIVYYSKEDGGLYNDIWTLTRNGASWDSSCTHTQLSTDSTTQYNPVYSPDGKRIAFEDDSGSPGTWNIWTMNASGGDRQQLTTGGGRGPLYSPDGLKIIYFSQENVSAYWDVWLMTTSGQQKTQLTIEQADQLYGCFSPDGSKIAYVSTEDSGSYEDIWVMNFFKDNLNFTVSGNTHVHVTINTNRTVDFYADENWFGLGNITFRATDPNGYYDEDTLTVTVNPVNDAPVVKNIPDMMFAEDSTDSNLDLDYFVSDVDNLPGELSCTYSGNTNVLISIDAVTHKVTFSTVPDWNGQESVTFKATDPQGLNDTDTINVTVTPVNDAPVLANIPDVTFDEDTVNSTMDLDDYVSDPDNAKAELTWEAIYSNTITVSINPVTKVVTFSAKADWNGHKNVTFKVTDPSSLWDIDTITVTVIPVNDAPVVTGPVPDFSMPEDTVDSSTIDLSNVFTDVDNDPLTYWVTGDVNINVTIGAGGTVTLKPVKDWNGEEILVFSASDGQAPPVTDTVKVNVTPVNDPAVINDLALAQFIAQQSIYEDTDFALDLSQFVTDVDNDHSQLTVSASSTYATVSGMIVTFNYPDGILLEKVVLTVSDGEFKISTTVTLTIIAVNDPPVLAHIPDITIDESETVIISAKAADIDNNNADLEFTYSGDMESWLWITDYHDAGTYTVNVSVSDGELTDWQLVTVIIKDIPQPPVIGLISDQEIPESVPFTLQVESWDWDNDTLTYSLDTAPAGMTIDSVSGLLSWQPAWSQVGVHIVTVKVSDGMFSSTRQFTITVINVNDPPVANYIHYTGVKAYEGEELDFTLRITGTKYMAVSMALFEDKVMLDKETIIRQPGNPDEQTVTIKATLDLSNDYTLALEYIADKLGATPVKLTMGYDKNYMTIHYTFNAMHSEKKEVIYDLNAILENNPANDKTVRFDASASYDPDGTIVKYLWNFGDGQSSSSAVVTHKYKKIDWYEVTLTLTDNEGESTEITFRVNPSFKTILVPEGGATDVVDYNVTGDSQITAVYVSNPSKTSEGNLGIYVDYTIEGGGSLNWVNLTIEYSEADIPKGMKESDLKLYWWDELNETWVACVDSGVDTENNVVWANVTHFTVFSAMAMQDSDRPAVAKQDSIWLTLIFAIVIFFILGIVVTAGVARSERMFVPLALMVGQMFVPPNYKTDNVLRGRILGMIEARPGVHYSWIKINIGKGNGVCAYHLDKLEKDGAIKTKRDGTFKRYYPSGSKQNGEHGPVLSDIQRQMREIIQEHPGASQKEIGYLLDEPKSKVNYHLKKMERGGLIRIERDERGHTFSFIRNDNLDYIPARDIELPLKEVEVRTRMKIAKKKDFSERRSTKQIIKKHDSMPKLAEKNVLVRKPRKNSKTKNDDDVNWEE